MTTAAVLFGLAALGGIILAGIRLGGKPVWLSTAGLGVGWLHVRLDDRPKYYRHAPYVREEARA